MNRTGAFQRKRERNDGKMPKHRFPGGKYLLIHMDDAGVSYAANRAVADLFGKGIARSASILINGPWAYDMVRWSRQNPSRDVGVHLTHTCEYDRMRWKPTADSGSVPTLLDADGFLPKTTHEVAERADGKEFRTEMEAQIRQAERWGLRPSHIDSHMVSVAARPDFYRAYLELAAQHGLTAKLFGWAPSDPEIHRLEAKIPTAPSVDIRIPAADSLEQMKRDFHAALNALGDGFYLHTVHPVADMEENRYLMPEFHARRCLEYRFYMDDEVKAIIDSCGFRIISWGDVPSLIA